jgi:hypothetical protein
VESSDKTLEAPGTGQPSGTRGKADRGPAWRSLLVGLAVALVMVSIVAMTYVWANHVYKLPWGEVGSSPLTAAVGRSISLDVKHYASEADLEQAANETKIYGGFVAASNKLIISEAASLWACGVMPAAYRKAAKASGQQIQIKTINRLPSIDPEGSGSAACCSFCW